MPWTSSNPTVDHQAKEMKIRQRLAAAADGFELIERRISSLQKSFQTGINSPYICNIYIHIDVLQVLNSVLNINFYAQIQMAMAQNWVPPKKMDG